MKNIKFLLSAFDLRSIPKEKLPEVVLCGRSNVGKSSFINTVFNRKNLAKTSSSPGKTRSLNYYLVEDKFYIVDLPGFGYAKVSKTERENWGKLIESYFNSSRNLSLAMHFIDSRHSPTKLDIVLHDYLRQIDIPYKIILTKIDKLNQSEKSSAKRRVVKVFPDFNSDNDIILFSALSKFGKEKSVDVLKSRFL